MGELLRSHLLMALGLWCGSAVAQILHPQQPMPSFEVATIKPWKPSQPAPTADGGPGAVKKIVKMAPVGSPPLSQRVHFIGQIQLLIESAYNLPVSSGNRILGGPEWVRSEGDRYELMAKIDDAKFAEMQRLTVSQQQGQVARMEQTLLAERLGLKVHFEMREMPVYTLVIAKGGAKLTASSGSDPSRLTVARSEGENDLAAKSVTMDELVRSPFLRGIGRPVFNQTGIVGPCDFSLKWSADEVASSEGSSAVPGLFPALEEQLGLKLVASRGPVEVIVIDHIDRPSDN
ncbi:TIGR03435 family protein [Terriglobus roseus]|uniref:Soil-associated protein, TIGR03435 family n=1 Tax=Terriglobus roseus TaxID=392734 RepID=A0A1H4SXY6_9BACT|nr:TIGR03435 family protein [Terriglobus roseus]SEC48958.1 soil-associated protein, TIGR03435 family [Terriglobus roseus]